MDKKTLYLSSIFNFPFRFKFHQFLAFKFQRFGYLRKGITLLKTNGYLKSYILRYIEEALAQGRAMVQSKGFNWQNIWQGVKFPVGKYVGDNGYVTIAKMGQEAKGILLGPINVYGMIYNVYFSLVED